MDFGGFFGYSALGHVNLSMHEKFAGLDINALQQPYTDNAGIA